MSTIQPIPSEEPWPGPEMVVEVSNGSGYTRTPERKERIKRRCESHPGSSLAGA